MHNVEMHCTAGLAMLVADRYAAARPVVSSHRSFLSSKAGMVSRVSDALRMFRRRIVRQALQRPSQLVAEGSAVHSEAGKQTEGLHWSSVTFGAVQ